MPEVVFGEWLPDSELIASPGLRVATNLIPSKGGWRYIPSQKTLGLGALNSACIGADRGELSNGQNYNAAGTATKLYLDTGVGYTDATNVGGDYDVGEDQNWGFTQWGTNVFATGSAVPQYVDLGSEVLFQDMPDDAPSAKVAMVFQDFLVYGNIKARGAQNYGTQEGGLHWSGLGKPLTWPLIGTDTAASEQSDVQFLSGDGGEIRAMVPAGEYALIFRERQVWRMDYVGPPLIFTFRKLDDQRGCIGQNAAIAVGPLVYYPSADGFKVSDGASTHSIGHDKVDITWRDTLDHNKTARISVMHDVNSPAIYWTVPGATIGSPAAILGYQYEIGYWFGLNTSVEWLQSIIPHGSSMDELVNDPTYGDMDMDLDDPDPLNPTVGLGNVYIDTLGSTADIEFFGAWLTDHILYAFNNENGQLTGVIETGDYDLENRAMLRWIRPVFTGGTGVVVTASTAARNIPNDSAVVYKATKPLNSLGVCPARMAGRYIRGSFETSGKISEFQGFDTKTQPLGSR